MSMTGLKVPRKILINDLASGLVMAVVSIPGALANGLLAGVNPVFGLYSVIAGTTMAALGLGIGLFAWPESTLGTCCSGS